jgi:hypothetical protein
MELDPCPCGSSAFVSLASYSMETFLDSELVGCRQRGSPFDTSLSLPEIEDSRCREQTTGSVSSSSMETLFLSSHPYIDDHRVETRTAASHSNVLSDVAATFACAVVFTKSFILCYQYRSAFDDAQCIEALASL